MAYQTEIILLTSPAPTDGTDTEDLSSGGNIYVGQNVNVVDEGTTDSSTPIYCNGDGSAIIDGFVYGFNALTFAGSGSLTTSIAIGATGDVSNFGGVTAGAVEVQTGPFSIDNAGTIQAVVYAVVLDFNTAKGVFGSGGGTLKNTGIIEAALGVAIRVGDSTSSDLDTIFNYGTISGGIESIGDSTLSIDNTGTIDGAIASLSGGAIVLSNEGSIDGAVNLTGNGSSLVDSGKIEGDVSVGGNVVITETGVISSTDTGAALTTASNYGHVTNAGEIFGGAGTGVNLSRAGTNVLTNTGVISSQGGVALLVDDYYDVKNAGQISSLSDDAIHILNGGGAIVNTGTISSSRDDAILDGSLSQAGYIYNSGTISGPGPATGPFDAIHEGGGHSETIFNSGLIDGGSDGTYGSAIEGDLTTVVNLYNSGDIDGLVSFNALGSSIDNSGDIEGWVTLAEAPSGGIADFLNSANGIIAANSGQNAVTIPFGAYSIFNAGQISAAVSGTTSGTSAAVGLALDASGGPAGTLNNSGTIYGDGYGVSDFAASGIAFLYNYGVISSLGDAIFDGNGTGTTGHGVQLFNYGTISSPTFAVAASAVDKEALYNKGDIDGEIDLAAAGSFIDNGGTIAGPVVFGGGSGDLINDGVIDGSVEFVGANDVFNGALGQVTGVVFDGGTNGTYIAGLDNETFNFVTFGVAYVRGGAGSDTFEFSVASLTSATNIVGGAGADTIKFTDVGTIVAAAFAHTSGIAAITLANGGTNRLAIGNALATSANGGVLTINGGTGAEAISIFGVTTATDHVTINSGGGADTINAGAAIDTFAFHAVAESTGPTYDTITGVNFTHDYFDVSAFAGSILAINAAITTGTLASGANFNADLAAVLVPGVFGASDAVLFTPNAGNLAGHTFLIVDGNHQAGYQANADLVINVTGAVGALKFTNFV